MIGAASSIAIRWPLALACALLEIPGTTGRLLVVLVPSLEPSRRDRDLYVVAAGARCASGRRALVSSLSDVQVRLRPTSEDIMVGTKWVERWEVAIWSEVEPRTFGQGNESTRRSSRLRSTAGGAWDASCWDRSPKRWRAAHRAPSSWFTRIKAQPKCNRRVFDSRNQRGLRSALMRRTTRAAWALILGPGLVAAACGGSASKGGTGGPAGGASTGAGGVAAGGGSSAGTSGTVGGGAGKGGAIGMGGVASPAGGSGGRAGAGGTAGGGVAR
jgi:hypothetical protein